MVPSRPKVSLIIPALDEEAAIGGVVSGFRGLEDSKGDRWFDEIVVVNNGSQDETAVQAQAKGATVVHEPEHGYGRACLAGLRYLEHREAGSPDIVVFADGDGTNIPTELPELLEPILDDRADLVIGARLMKGDRDGLTIPQRFGNHLAAYLLRFLYGVNTTDLGPYRAIRWTTIQALEMRDQDFGWTVEMQVKAAQMRFRMIEVDVSNKRRVAGKSKVSGTIKGVIGAGTKIIWTILANRP